MTNPEDEWVLKAGRGDRAAFDVLCRRLAGPLYGYAYGMVRQAEEAEDIAQEALFRLYRVARAGKLRKDPRQARSLAFTMVHNLAIDHLRRQRRSPEPLPSRRNGSTPAEGLLLREQVDRALEDLPESHRRAWMLREYGDLSYQDIARTLGATLDEVKIWIYRARKRLARLLDRDGQYVGDSQRGV